MKLRQVVFVCKDLESNAQELCETLGIEIAYSDPGVAKWGLANVVCPTGNDFLEIVSPQQDGTSAGRYIERREAGQPPCTHDLFAVAAEFGDTAVDALRTVLACYEAMHATEDHAT